MRPILGIDIESASGVGIDYGPDAYSQHESTAVYCVVFGYAKKAGSYRFFTWEPGKKLPSRIRRMLEGDVPLLAHNASFENAMWEHILAPEFDFPPVPYTRWQDTMSVAAALNLPQSLDGLSTRLKCATVKDLEGAKVMKKMAKLTLDENGEWSCKHNTRENRRILRQYCRDDVGAMLDCWFKMPRLSGTEERLRKIDQRINHRGMCLDRAFATKCQKIADLRVAELADDAFFLSDGMLKNATSVPALKRWVKSHGVRLEQVSKVSKATGQRYLSEVLDSVAVNRMIDDPDTPDVVREMLTIRKEAGKTTSLAKLKRAASNSGSDGRIRYELRYNSTKTGRWASKGLQVHNLPSPKMSAEMQVAAKEFIDDLNIEGLKLVLGNVLSALSMSLRSVVVAGPGMDIIAADYSAIEARVIAWLAGQENILEEFRNGKDVYLYTATVILDSDYRPLGKVCVLALNYGMGDLLFHATAKKPPYNVEMTLKEARRIKTAYREANAKIVQFWADLENAAREAIRNPGTYYDVGYVSFVTRGTSMRMILPSGRAIHYWHPRVVRATKRIKCVNDDGEIVVREMTTDEIRYKVPSGPHMKTEKTYGGKLAENVSQAVARDLLGHSLELLEEAGYPCVIHVHDSAAAEVPSGTGDVEEFCRIMEITPDWAEGLPVAAEGYRGPYFRG